MARVNRLMSRLYWMMLGVVVLPVWLAAQQADSPPPTPPPVSTSGPAAGQEPEDYFRSLLKAELEAYHAENMEQLFAMIDPRVEKMDQRRMILNRVFELTDIDYSLDHFTLLYHDAELAIARYQQTMRRVNGPPTMTDNQLNALMIFRFHEGQWRIFEQVKLEMQILEPLATQPTSAPASQPTATPPANDSSGEETATESPTTQPAAAAD
ncbi:MAG: hypothetical protein HJJLKODD_02032 [Phycisphaerae bacterium]|nr:hypothetical protein [Phycisphaerae bacterium]